MRDGGRLIIWRKLEDDWKWKSPLYRSAWTWMLMKAAYVPHNGLKRGQLYFSISQAPKDWGMSRDQARRFLQKCERGYKGQEPDIIWDRGRPGVRGSSSATSGATSRATSPATSGATSRGIITLLNYNKYNPLLKQDATSPATSFATSGASSTATIEKESIKNQREEVPGQPSADSPPSPDTKSKKRKSPSNNKTVTEQTKEDTEKAIYGLDLDKFRSKYAAVDIDHEHPAFADFYLGKNDPKTGKPNWMKWTDWNLAFHTWCRNAVKWNGQRERTQQQRPDAPVKCPAHRKVTSEDAIISPQPS